MDVLVFPLWKLSPYSKNVLWQCMLTPVCGRKRLSGGSCAYWREREFGIGNENEDLDEIWIGETVSGTGCGSHRSGPLLSPTVEPSSSRGCVEYSKVKYSGRPAMRERNKQDRNMQIKRRGSFASPLPSGFVAVIERRPE
jgi:hypothetical protein